jgi:hypothetical protein
MFGDALLAPAPNPCHIQLGQTCFRHPDSLPADTPVNVRSRRVADLDWRLGRVYFLAFLKLSRRQPDPALTARLVASPATVDEATTELG